MNPRRLLALVCAVAIPVGMFAWLHAANRAPSVPRVERGGVVQVQIAPDPKPTPASRDVVAPGAVTSDTKKDSQLPTGSVTVSVVDDASGQPLTATFQVQRGFENPFSAHSDAQGRARMDGIASGDVVLRVFSPSRVPLTRTITVRPGETTDVGVVRMLKPISIAGSVDTATVSAPTHMAFAYLIEPGGSAGKPPTATTPIGDDGQFMFSGMSPGEYLLSTVANPSPSVEDVQADKLRGWVYVPAAFGDVSGVQIR